jgi:hypothetical protein
MKVFALITLLVIGATGCGIFKKKNSELKSVKIEGTVHKPYCGGAKPSPDVAAGYFESMKFAEYKLYKGADYTEKAEYLQEVRMDISGVVKLQLAPGDYFLLRADKTLSMDQFIALNGPVEEKLYSKSENSCFQEWMRTADLKFTVVNDTVIEFRENAKCWVGTNPCIKYIGPPAP